MLLTAEDLSQFDSHCKVLPPLRAETDRQALLAGLADGTIDCIASNHCPRELERKSLEFAYADFGAATLSTAFAAARTGAGTELEEELLIGKFTQGPRRVFGLPEHRIEVGAPAELTIYQYDAPWKPTTPDIHSRSKNSPLVGRQLSGRPVGAVRGDRIFLHAQS